ncbi:quinoprotein dehydrogenase-associated SoxYZ-like carrier [Paracoccus sp. (in: a-proteobacteria)]|uniref:quinoprotein dehydrogenase-associated SoxYZ-like carrier n=1 Tax=Paracoccus sp. TaxID=267 RepID=UPI003A8A58CE
MRNEATRYCRRGFLALALICAALPIAAQESWDAVRAQLYDDRPLLAGKGVIALDAPYRTADDARTRVAAQITAPAGGLISRVAVVLDENPMPVSADFALSQPQPYFFFDATLRINGPTPVHVVAEMTDGRVFVSGGFIKTSGQGACAAPPGSDPKLALATLGRMRLSVSDDLPGDAGAVLAGMAAGMKRLELDISHPSHSGMQMDQVTLLFIPMRYVETVGVSANGTDYLRMTGSISLAEDPQIGMSVPAAIRRVDVTLTDTDGTVSSEHTELAGM